jgi:hypothetical protein
MKFSFGPSEIPKWKREQFPNIKYDEYTYERVYDEYRPIRLSNFTNENL